jgi:hypothetical protein
MPDATPLELASAIVQTVDAGTQILNLSASLTQGSAKGENELESALNYAPSVVSLLLSPPATKDLSAALLLRVIQRLIGS